MSEGPEELGSTIQNSQSPASAVQDPVHIRELVDLPPRAMRGSFHNRAIAQITAAANHQLAIARIDTAKRARHDPDCRWCAVKVPWRPAALRLIPQLRARDGNDGPAAPNSRGAAERSRRPSRRSPPAQLGRFAASRDTAPAQGPK